MTPKKPKAKHFKKWDTTPDLIGYKRLCEKCKKQEAYWSATWCGDCIWRFVQE